MSSTEYKIVFSGEIIPGQNIEEVKKRIAAFCKVSVSRCSHLFTGRIVIIKKNLDYHTAEKYKRAFDKTGAICKIEKIAQETENVLTGNRLPKTDRHPCQQSKSFKNSNPASQSDEQKKSFNIKETNIKTGTKIHTFSEAAIRGFISGIIAGIIIGVGIVNHFENFMIIAMAVLIASIFNLRPVTRQLFGAFVGIITTVLCIAISLIVAMR